MDITVFPRKLIQNLKAASFSMGIMVDINQAPANGINWTHNQRLGTSFDLSQPFVA